MIDIETGLTHIYNSFKECQDKNNIPRHDIISKRCRGINKKPYLNKYMFVYVVQKCVSTRGDECNLVELEISTSPKQSAR